MEVLKNFNIYIYIKLSNLLINVYLYCKNRNIKNTFLNKRYFATYVAFSSSIKIVFYIYKIQRNIGFGYKDLI